MTQRSNKKSGIDPHTALVYSMVLVSASDRDMTDAELMTIGDIVQHLPVFQGFDFDGLAQVAGSCASLLSAEDGLDKTLDLIRSALPAKLRETAYALACDVAAADGSVHQEELQLLELIRHRLGIDRLASAAIERGTRARFATI
jgi:tellurite resistance protein